MPAVRLPFISIVSRGERRPVAAIKWAKAHRSRHVLDVFVNLSPASRKHPLSQFSSRDRCRFVTELLPANVSSVKSGAVDEFGMAGVAAGFSDLVESGDLVVGVLDPGQRRQY